MLLYAADSKVLTAEQLGYLDTPEALSHIHNPMGYGQFIDMVKLRFAEGGIDILKEEYVTAADGQRFFGTMRIGLDGFEYDGMDIIVGLRGSHDRSVSRGLCIGNRVMVCSNLQFDGNFGTFSRKQTLNAWDDVPAMIENVITALPVRAQQEAQRADLYKRCGLSHDVASGALAEIYRKGGLSSTQLGKAINQWHEPAHEEHAEDGFSAWRLINACTEAVKPAPGKGISMETIAQRTRVQREVIDGVCEVVA
jgi:hypothetical protein